MSPAEACLMEEKLNPSVSAEERIFDIICKEDDLSWKDMIYDLVRNENMNPWDINVTVLAERFLNVIKQLKDMDFRIGGKIVLASSLLLKLKSDRLVGADIANFERLLVEPAEEEFMDEDGFEFEQTDLGSFLNDQKKLVPRTPQPRERQVSVFDLVDALEKALDTDYTKQRNRLLRSRDIDIEPEAPKNYFELGKTMDSLHKSLTKMFMKPNTKILFNDLLTAEDKESKVYTFLPLLHLEHQRKVELLQEEHFGEIEVKIMNKTFV